jgi:hypothetical protein
MGTKCSYCKKDITTGHRTQIKDGFICESCYWGLTYPNLSLNIIHIKNCIKAKKILEAIRANELIESASAD